MSKIETRHTDKNGTKICVGDILFVSDGCNSFQGMVEIQDGRVVVMCPDGDGEKSLPLDIFHTKNRTRLNEKGRYNYWKMILGKKPPKSLWKIGA